MEMLNGDCLELMKDISDKSIDMILCDLSYGTTACKWDTVIPFDKLWEQYNRIIKDDGAIVLFGSEPFSSHLRLSNLKFYKYDWIWQKQKPTNFYQVRYSPLKEHENISVFCKKKPKYFPQGTIEVNIKSGRRNKSSNLYHKYNGGNYVQKTGNYPRSILKFSTEGDKNRIHPTQKPVALLEYLVKTYTNESDLVLDNRAGSMSTAIACLNTNRDFIMIEKDELYFAIGKNRVEKHMREEK